MSAEFDQFSDSYEEDLHSALSVTGEGQEYYARERLVWLGKCLADLGRRPDRVLDFGCGVGMNSPLLLEYLGVSHVLGIDVSEKSIAIAREKRGPPNSSFETVSKFKERGSFDLAFCNGVFHHIEPGQRQDALAILRSALREGGILAFWENNPWNPGTKYVMSKCVFDENAITLSIPEAKKMLREAGFQILRTDTLFYFPAQLSALRPLGSLLRRLPFGGQYQVLAQYR